MIEAITGDELLAYMHKNGFVWGQSDIDGMDLLTKGSFKWYLPSGKANPIDLIKAIEHEALNRGIKK